MSTLPVSQQAGRPVATRETVIDPVPILDTARYEHMGRIATMLTNAELVPDTLAKTKEDGRDVFLPAEVIRSRVFVVVNQAVRWGMDPFAVLQSVSMVRGKLCYEGKLVAAVLEARAGIALDYEWDTEPGDRAGITVTGKLPDGRVRSIKGTVGEWKTDGNQSPWKNPKNHPRMLSYRGAREWTRIFMPGVLLGVYTEDELGDMQEAAREVRRARIQPPAPIIAAATPVGETLIEHRAPRQEPAQQQSAEPVEPGRVGDQQEAAEKAAPGEEEQQVKPEKPAERHKEADQPRKAPPPPPPSKKPAQAAQEAAAPAAQQGAETEDEPVDWDAELQGFQQTCESAEAASEIQEAKEAHAHLFDMLTPKEAAERADAIVAAALERIGAQE